MNTLNDPTHGSELHRLRAENEHLRRTNMGMVSRVVHEAALAEIQKEAERLRAELEKRTKWYLKVLKELARGDYEISHVSDSRDMTVIFPRALYESRFSHPMDEHLLDLIANDPLEKQARALTPQADGLEENRREIWRARLAQMRRVGIVISEGKS